MSFLTIKGLYAEPVFIPQLESLSIGQDQSALNTIANLEQQPSEQPGIKRFFTIQETGRTLIVTIEQATGKIVQIALVNETDIPDTTPIFGHFRFNETRQRDIVNVLGKSTLNFTTNDQFAPITVNKELHHYLHYKLNNDQILSFVTQERETSADLSFIVKKDNFIIVDPSATYRIKADTRIADGFLKAIILTDPTFAEQLTEQKIAEDVQTIAPFLPPDLSLPQTEGNFHFSDVYISGAPYQGPQHDLSFSGENAAFKADQTAIREIVKKAPKPIFASEYAIIPVYFSTAAHDFYFFNLRTGTINKFPLGTDQNYLKLFTRSDSSLLEARWEETGLCKKAYYLFDNSEWRVLGTETNGFAEACENINTAISQ